MFRHRLSWLCLLCCCLLTAGLLGAAEVALVTEKTGSVTATMASDTWEIELAEILQDGVEIKVGSDGSLVIIHLPTNQEYRFAANATANVAMASVTGENFTSTAVQMVSGQVGLGQEMANQTGAVNPERVGVASPAPAPAPSLQRSANILPPPAVDPNTTGKQPEILAADSSDEAKGPVVDPSGNKAIDNFASQEHEERMDLEKSSLSTQGFAPRKPKNAIIQADKIDEPSAEAGAQAGASPVAVDEPLADMTLALPSEVFARICSDESSFSVAGEKLTGSRIKYASEGWVEIDIFCEEGFSGNMSLNGNVASMTIEAFAPAIASVAAAWRLEKHGHLYQAAAMWLTLQKDGLPEKKVAPHLKRIKAAILNLNK